MLCYVHNVLTRLSGTQRVKFACYKTYYVTRSIVSHADSPSECDVMFYGVGPKCPVSMTCKICIVFA